MNENEERRLDQTYQDGFKDPLNLSKEGCPPCPRCNGKMIPWDAWLVTGAKCEECGWGMTEGTGRVL